MGREYTFRIGPIENNLSAQINIRPIEIVKREYNGPYKKIEPIYRLGHHIFKEPAGALITCYVVCSVGRDNFHSLRTKGLEVDILLWHHLLSDLRIKPYIEF